MTNYMRCLEHRHVTDKGNIMSTLEQEITEKIKNIFDTLRIDIMILSDIYNIQYSTGVKIPCSHAQRDLVMIALLNYSGITKVILPECWVALAVQTKFDAQLLPYSIDQDPLTAASSVLKDQLTHHSVIGSDDNNVSLKLAKMISDRIKESGARKIEVEDNFTAARVTKTKNEIAHIRSIALKTDHAINGYFHHLIADRSKSSMSISENLRIHSLERDIEIEGYNACSRGVIGQNIKNIWAYAPIFGFASNDFTDVGDTIIADAMNNERGYWSNATRIGIMADNMSEDQTIAYNQLVQLRKIICKELIVGRTASEVYHSIVEKAQTQNLSILNNHGFGFSVGVSTKEAPFLVSGDETFIKSEMTMVLDCIIEQKGLLYRSRDTVLITDNGHEFLNCYKDWREPYFALNTI